MRDRLSILRHRPPRGSLNLGYSSHPDAKAPICATMATTPTIPPQSAPAPEPTRKISFVSLGCPKALVDSERIVTRLRAEGYELARRHDGADLVIVNTCGFLDSAQAESLEAIGAALKDNGKVIVTGCMGAEPEKITAHFPNVLAVTGPQQYESVVAAVHPPRLRMTHSSTCSLRRGSNLPRGTTLISRFQRVVTIAAHFALSRNCAATWSRGRLRMCCARPSGWSPPASRSCW